MSATIERYYLHSLLANASYIIDLDLLLLKGNTLEEALIIRGAFNGLGAENLNRSTAKELSNNFSFVAQSEELYNAPSGFSATLYKSGTASTGVALIMSLSHW